MEVAAASCRFLLVATIFIHYEVPRLLTRSLPMRLRPCLQLVFVILGAFCAHFVEILLYSTAYWLLASQFDLGSKDQSGPLLFPAACTFPREPTPRWAIEACRPVVTWAC
jgi:hypothetical protein